MKLSVVMPVYNEQPTLREVIARVLAVPDLNKNDSNQIDLELICVDDGSRDGSREILAELAAALSRATGLALAGVLAGLGAPLRNRPAETAVLAATRTAMIAAVALSSPSSMR